MSDAASPEARLTELMASVSNDPLEFVRVAFPWGEDGPLQRFTGSHPWQAQVLTDIRDGLQTPGEVIRLAVTHGHCAGGTTLLAWIALWAMGTRVNTRVIVTAGTEAILRTITCPTLAWWLNLFIGKHWFSLRFDEGKCFGSMVKVEADYRMTWRLDMCPATDHVNFAGLLNWGNRTVVLMDSPASIAEPIWDTIEGGAMRDNAQAIWCAFGQDTLGNGPFHECFVPRWHTRRVDSRTVETVNQDQVWAMQEEYGEDSDLFRVHVRGLFPKRRLSLLI